MRENHEGLRLCACPDCVRVVFLIDASLKLDTGVARIAFVCKVVDSEWVPAGKGHDFTNAVAWGSKRHGRVHQSSTTAEAAALGWCMSLGAPIVAAVRKLWGCRVVGVTVFTDSRPLLHQIEGSGSKTEPRMRGLLDFARQELHEMGAKLEWLDRADNVADMLTKPIWP